MPQDAPLPQDPLLASLRRAIEGTGTDRVRWRERLAPWIRRLRDEGRGRYGDLGLGDEGCQIAVFRLVELNLLAERRRQPSAALQPETHAERLIFADGYLAEALVQDREAAWDTFSGVLASALRQAARHSSGIRARWEELEDDLLALFFGGEKVATYRATAPIAAWARQVVINVMRQRLQGRSRLVTETSLPSLRDPDGQSGLLEPASTAPGPEDEATRREWREALRAAVPKALQGLDRDERRMLSELPVRRITQVEMAQELGVSPFKMNRWYKEVRGRFLRRLTHELRLAIGLASDETEELVSWLTAALERDADSAQRPDPA